MKLPPNVELIIQTLENCGFEAFVVGGAVRDFLLGLKQKDYDIATSATPGEMHSALSSYKLVDIGIKHGTVTAVFDDLSVEITTYRIDGVYSDNRRPDHVSFTRSLKEDLSRRDFSVNAMAFSAGTGIIDFFGGKSDLENKTLRCIGNAERRFEEDALRILRAMRFMAELDFHTDDLTEKALFSKKELIENISPERITSEFKRIICGRYAERVLLGYKEIFAVIVPELKPCFNFNQHNKYHIYDVYTHLIKALVSVPEKETTVRIAMLFHDIGKPDCFKDGHFYGHARESVRITENVLKRLCFNKRTSENVLTLVKYHDCPISSDEKKIKRMLNRFGENGLRRILLTHIADDSAKSDLVKKRIENYKLVQKTADEIIMQKACFTLKDLAVNGHDIVGAGYCGKEAGKALEFLLSAVINERILNKKEDLLYFLDKNKKL